MNRYAGVDSAEKHPETRSLYDGQTQESAPERNIRLTGQKINGWFIARYIAAIIGIWVALLTPTSVTLALRVGQLDPAHKASSLAFVASLGAFVAIFANPIFGALSDSSTSRFGQRRPYIVGGMLGGTLAIFFIGFFASTLSMVAIGWVAAQLCFNAAIAATVSILPERIPSKLRGKVSGWMGMTTQVGVVGGVFLIQLSGTEGYGAFVWPAVVGALMVAPLLLTLREIPKTQGEVVPLSLQAVASSLWINPIEYRDFALAWLGRFLVWMSLYTLTTYKTYFLIDTLHYTTKTVAPVLTAAMFTLAVCIAISSIPSGWLSDKVGRRKPFVIAASLLFALAMIIVAHAGSIDQFIVGIGVAGLAQGMYLGVDYALVAEVLPDSSEQAARGMGFFNLSTTIPQTLAPVLAPVLLRIGATNATGNYAALFSGAAVFAVVAACITQLIRGVR
ncbi:MFS transporter [Paraburkholderia sp. DHOC27]|uniref:MFS transporter n=1 Tax=Paraburkholderia sp. DHOC27 TaxID=2303330 RepID=UPI001C6FFC7C|nr:MFS transporter [Paraburkholderia sp. DHOC27]